MELYIHIPFCVRKCGYCDFLSFPADAAAQEAYMEALLREVKWAGGASGKGAVETVFIGGGTPSVLETGWIRRLLDAVYHCFSVAEGAEITIEANPGALTGEKLRGYRGAGINRLSMGLQSMDNRELYELGRIHTAEEFLENYYMAREAGFDNINIDLMSALPGQTTQSWEETLGRTAELSPEHISAYSLMIEEGTPFWERYGEGREFLPEREKAAGDGSLPPGRKPLAWSCPPLPSEEEDRAMYHRTKELLAEAGYGRYEISNYARPGYECRHNVGYWTRVPYLGLGLGAASFYGGERFSNVREMGRYLALAGQEGGAGHAGEEKASAGGGAGERGRFFGTASWREEAWELSGQDAMEEFMFLGLRLTAGIRAEDFRHAFGREIESVYGSVLERLTGQGLLVRTESGWRLSEWGLDVSNRVLAEFLLEE